MLRKSIAAILLCISSAYCYSETGTKIGTIEYIRVHDTQLATWEPPSFWFTVNQITSAAGCKRWNGNVLFMADSEQMLSLVLAAHMADQSIAVHYDDSKITNTFCRAIHVSLGNPPPNN